MRIFSFTLYWRPVLHLTCRINFFEWGCVRAYDPPNRLVLVWRLNTDWKYDPDLETIVEVRFIAENSTSTMVELEHRQLEAYGERAELMAFKLGSPDAWSGLLSAFTELTGMGHQTVHMSSNVT
ncbi:MAG: hypothetical protein GY742_15395 [Hyphomicrobiales bacterium]|nr:hypothetical protein [Hyphomicrobiales bacterium]